MARFALMFIPLIVVLVVVVVNYTRGTVSRARLERFAGRQRLRVTVDNGNQVIRYLATIRRWRVAGFVGGIVASQVNAPEGTIIHFNFITIFTGWFIGALIAEARVEHLAHGLVRMASLQPRQPHRYVRRFAWALLPATAVVAFMTAVATAAAAALGWADPQWAPATLLLVVAIAVAVTVRLIQLAVLRRPQPVGAPDVIEADDAIRSRSLHVLSGGGSALVLFTTFNLLSTLHPRSAGAQEAIDAVTVLGTFAVALLGWLVATSLWPPPSAPGVPALGTA
jgi:hypothetical protein